MIQTTASITELIDKWECYIWRNLLQTHTYTHARAHTHTHTETDRQRERKRHAHTEGERERETHTHTHRERERERPTNLCRYHISVNSLVVLCYMGVSYTPILCPVYVLLCVYRLHKGHIILVQFLNIIIFLSYINRHFYPVRVIFSCQQRFVLDQDSICLCIMISGYGKCCNVIQIDYDLSLLLRAILLSH